jgi:hypothetical protein
MDLCDVMDTQNPILVSLEVSFLVAQAILL